ncbi:MAG: AAA family ATPase [Gammaproteobacteria bacterium]
MTDSRQAINDLRERMGRSIIGQEEVVERLLLTLLCDGNVLVEGLPGLAKTRAVKSLARNLESEFSRIQFTPDLLPSDITGSEMYLGEDAEQRFIFQPGPIFANILLADEVNRAPAKVQAALLEAMEERQATVAGKTQKLMPEKHHFRILQKSVRGGDSKTILRNLMRWLDSIEQSGRPARLEPFVTRYCEPRERQLIVQLQKAAMLGDHPFPERKPLLRALGSARKRRKKERRQRAQASGTLPLLNPERNSEG